MDKFILAPGAVCGLNRLDYCLSWAATPWSWVIILLVSLNNVNYRARYFMVYRSLR